VRFAKASARTFPPPLRGRDRERGGNKAQVRSWRIISLIGLFAAGPVLVPVPAASADRVLETFRANQFVVDLTIAECRSSECPIEVRLRTHDHVIDRVTLPIAARSQCASAEPVDALWGADAGRKAWATGEEEQYVSTAARLLRLVPRTPALLVSQRYGFEHLKRNHLLLVPRAGKLVVAWKAEEGAGPTWSAMQVIGGPGRQQIAYFNGFSEPEEDVAERLDAVRLSWNAATARVQESPLPAPNMPLYLLDLGTHATVAQARQARTANTCESHYWVLEAARFRAGASDKALIGMLYIARAAADQAARSAERCLPGADARILTVTP
jgi:hypothetical protein